MPAEFDIQQAIYTVLSGNATLAGLGVSVVDFGPDADDGSTIYPYVSIGMIFLGEWDTDDTTGFNMLARIHSYSNTGAAGQTKTMQGAIYDALHRVALAVTGYDTITVHREESFVQRTQSGAFHGVCEYRGLLDKT